MVLFGTASFLSLGSVVELLMPVHRFSLTGAFSFSRFA